jgi:chitinase
MNSLLDTYPFDGIDIDIEHGNSILASGTISNPTSADCVNLIDGITQIKAHYANTHSSTMMLTFAPETAYVQGGMSAYGGIWGGYLPLLDALRNDINFIHVQLYNSGTVYGIDGGIYAQGTADFIVAMTEAMIQGFSTAGGMFAGFPEEKIVVGLPACPSAAGGGFCSPAVVAAAIDYLHGNGNAPGNYTLVHAQGYPQLGGMMTWSINWDAVATCNASAYEYASNYEQLFETVLAVDDQSTIEKSLLYPNPAQSFVQLGVSNANYFIVNTLGQVVKTGQSSPTGQIEIADIPDGFYSIRCLNTSYSFLKSVTY